MFRRSTLVVVGIASILSAAPSVVAAPRDIPVRIRELQAEREAIEQMPLAERPNRPGHFYGNNVRRVYYRKVRVNKHRGVQGPLGF